MLLRSSGYQDHDADPIVPTPPSAVPGAIPAQAGQPVALDAGQVDAINRRSPTSAGEVIGRRRNTNPLTPINPTPGVNEGIEGG